MCFSKSVPLNNAFFAGFSRFSSLTHHGANITGNKFDISIKHPQYDERPIEMASGAEKSLSAMAIRLALLGVSSLPTGDLFILDEPGTALDEDNMSGFIQILELIKVYFKNVLLISHLDSLKDCVDMQIVIDKKAGYAKVNQ